MKKLLLAVAFAIVSLVTLGFLPTVTVTIDNSSSYGLGTVTVSAPSSSSSISVSTPGTYTTQLGANASSVTINGQTVTSPTSGTVTLTNGASVIVSWPSTNVVEIVNATVHYAPQR